MPDNTSLHPELIEEGLNDVFFDTFEKKMPPQMAQIEDVFMMEAANKHNMYDIDLADGGQFQVKGEVSNPMSVKIKEKYKTTYTAATFAQDYELSKEWFDDDLYSVIKDIPKLLARNARSTREKVAFQILREGFTVAAGADGKTLYANDHPRDNGGTLDNLITAALTEVSLNTLIIQLMEQKSHSGTFVSQQPALLLVPPALFKTACEITEAEMRSATSDNDPNIYSSKYGITVKQARELGANTTGSTGSDTAWFLFADEHKVKGFTREAINTHFKDWKQHRNHNYLYGARYREVYGYSSPVGTAASTGTT